MANRDDVMRAHWRLADAQSEREECWSILAPHMPGILSSFFVRHTADPEIIRIKSEVRDALIAAQLEFQQGGVVERGA